MVLTDNLIFIRERIQAKFSIDSDEANDIIEFAIAEYRRLKNDYETLLKDYSDDVLVWIKKASYEIAERNSLGVSGGIKMYSENGYSFTVDGSILSKDLVREIIANVDYPK